MWTAVQEQNGVANANIYFVFVLHALKFLINVDVAVICIVTKSFICKNGDLLWESRKVFYEIMYHNQLRHMDLIVGKWICFRRTKLLCKKCAKIYSVLKKIHKEKWLPNSYKKKYTSRKNYMYLK